MVVEYGSHSSRWKQQVQQKNRFFGAMRVVAEVDQQIAEQEAEPPDFDDDVFGGEHRARQVGVYGKRLSFETQRASKILYLRRAGAPKS
jgi:hypothetical protein